MKKIILILSLLSLILSACGGQKYYLKVKEIEPRFEGLVLNNQKIENYGVAAEEGFIEITKIENMEYDSFFEKTAKLEALSTITKEILKDSNSYIKKYLKSNSSGNAVLNTVKDYQKEMEKLKNSGKISDSDKENLSKKFITMEIAYKDLAKELKEGEELLKKGKDLLNNVKKLPKQKILTASEGLRKSIANLQNFLKNVPDIINETQDLILAFNPSYDLGNNPSLAIKDNTSNDKNDSKNSNTNISKKDKEDLLKFSSDLLNNPNNADIDKLIEIANKIKEKQNEESKDDKKDIEEEKKAFEFTITVFESGIQDFMKYLEEKYKNEIVKSNEEKTENIVNSIEDKKINKTFKTADEINQEISLDKKDEEKIQNDIMK